jgi:hypothetical protein
MPGACTNANSSEGIVYDLFNIFFPGLNREIVQKVEIPQMLLK